ncbi:MAG: FKBP-type peptidyl-prolyl cis-trans isomerase [Bacteroidales bacterium]|jgi:FKBP-type peptidyl-prolyl cis-trans isomerase|nr:FKBP-type peptidyl-prolyl cis-trans isomerase [Bacteroidales bacterium]
MMKISKIFAIASAAVLMVACGGPAVEGSKEVKALLPTKAQTDSASYLIGVNFGSWIKGNNFGEINYDQMLKGIKDWMKAEGNVQDSSFFAQFKVDPNKMNEVLDGYIQKRRAYTGALNNEKGAKFIENFLKEEGAQKTESGLAYKIIEPGNDKKAVSDQDTVWVDYKGTLLDDTVFDENKDINFTLNRVIPGWAEGMKLIGEGGKVKLVIPGNLAYGEYGTRGIDPNSTLVFDVTLNKVGNFVAPVEEPVKK